MTLQTVQKYIEKNGLAEHCSIDEYGSRGYFKNASYVCDVLRVFTHEYQEIKKYLSRYKKSLYYELQYNFGCAIWAFYIYDREDHDRAAEILYYQKRSVSEVEQYRHEHPGCSDSEIRDIMRKHEKCYERSRRYGIYKTLTA